MTGVQLYLLLAPLVVMAVGGAVAYWWTHNGG